ncbi:MAG: hypothetical protein J0M08_04230 [Bacteroidetes bacterium]|nr:hypothetical protein [Bacteroidota bacterium]
MKLETKNLLLLFIFVSLILKAQINNPSFENWSGVIPNDWNTYNQYLGQGIPIYCIPYK